MLYLTQLTGFILITLINGEMSEDCTPDCPCLTDLPELVVRYGDSVSLSCDPFSNGTDLSWTITWDDMLILDKESFTMENLTDWEIQPMCQNGDQCNRTLPLTIYKLPDQVSISTVNHTGPMMEGRDYELQCDIRNVAPLKLLTVKWFKGNESVGNINFPNNSTKNPVNQSTRLQISPSANVTYRCEAMLNLGPRGPQPSPIVKSNKLNITVHPCPDLVLDPPELVVRYGDPVSVSCRSLSEYTDLGWDVSLGSVSLLDNKTVIWKTDHLTDWEIVPVCYMILNGVQCRRTLPLTVYKLPDEVAFSIVNHVGPMIEGKKYELQCEVYNFAPVNVLAAFWYKGEELLKNRGFAELPTKTPSNKTVSHKITAGRDEGEAQYWCEAKLKLGPAGPQPSPMIKSNLLKVAVHYKPVIKPCSDWSPMIHTPLSSFPYNVTGNPTPHINWHRDKSPVSSDMILSGNDSGTYELLANNSMGRASCVIKITVEYAPTFACLPSYEGREHDSFLDKCSVMASPVANITWEKDGKRVNPLHHLTKGDSGTYVITATNKHGTQQHSLTINVLYKPETNCLNWFPMINTPLSSYANNVVGNPTPTITWHRDKSPVSSDMILSRNNSGRYTLFTSNLMGNASYNINITVEYAPTFACLPSYEGREHDSFLDKCSVMASPVANITWEKDGKKVNPLHHLTKGDSGTYVLTATNKHGTQQHSLTINVLYGANIQYISPSAGVNVGEKVSLQCTAEGNPVPEVRWTFQNQNRTTGRQHTPLNIDKAKSADAGQYTCIATNELGTDTKTVSLTVQEINLRLIIILTVLSLVLLFFIIYIIYKCIQRRRSGQYNVQGTKGAVSVPLVQRNNGNGMKEDDS
ncbi:hemicentin-1-like isoform X1 [Clarias gariepinus]|uniref:hemicentin-1-like isoform X1 n=1 Tax=Clarias gariepinus TaxID=13013 RepID=UPI00234C8D75|nr:hemicentin-1-like isoform X1 [Clarias gariepinus]